MSETPLFSWDACLARVRAGENAAARDLVNQLSPLVMSIVAGRLPRRESAEDLAQEVFLKVFARLEQYRGEVPFRHWVSRIAVTTCIDALRKQKRRPELRWSDLGVEEEQALNWAETDEPFARPGENVGVKELIARILEGMPPAERKLIEWLDLEQKSVDEVVELTGWSKVIVKVRVFRARRRLQKLLSQLKSKEAL